MSVLIPFCLIDGIKESFNIKVEKGYALMRNLKDLVGTEDFLKRLELTFHQFYMVPGRFAPNPVHPLSRFAPISVPPGRFAPVPVRRGSFRPYLLI